FCVPPFGFPAENPEFLLVRILDPQFFPPSALRIPEALSMERRWVVFPTLAVRRPLRHCEMSGALRWSTWPCRRSRRMTPIREAVFWWVDPSLRRHLLKERERLCTQL